MRRTVEAIPPDPVTAIILVRNGVNVSSRRDRAVKCRIEYGNGGDLLPEHRPGSPNSGNVVRIVKWGELDEVFNLRQDCVVQGRGLNESFAAVNHSVPQCVDHNVRAIALVKNFPKPA